jgi:SAM-dependent methyltransferase
LKRYKAEYLDKLSAEDKSYPIPHIQRWISSAKLVKDTDWVHVLHAGDHDDRLDLWGQLRSCYNNGFKAATITLEGISAGRQQTLGMLRAPSLAQKWMQVEQLMSELGMAVAKFQIREDKNYWDTYWTGEEPDARFLAEHLYMLVAANYCVGNLLDVGCGNGLFLHFAWNRRPHFHQHERYDHPGYVVSKGAVVFPPFGQGIDTSPVAIQMADGYTKANPTGKAAFQVHDFLTEPGIRYADDHFDTVTMLDFLPFLNEGERQVAMDAAFRIARHRVIVTLPAFPLPIPNMLKRVWTRDEAVTLFKGFQHVTIDAAEIDDVLGSITRWILVGDKRPCDDPWHPKSYEGKPLEQPAVAPADGK